MDCSDFFQYHYFFPGSYIVIAKENPNVLNVLVVSKERANLQMEHWSTTREFRSFIISVESRDLTEAGKKVEVCHKRISQKFAA